MAAQGRALLLPSLRRQKGFAAGLCHRRRFSGYRSQRLLRHRISSGARPTGCSNRLSLGINHQAFSSTRHIDASKFEGRRPESAGAASRQETIYVRSTGFEQARSLAKALRPQQWVKNLFVLAPLLFSQNLFTPLAVGRALAAFLLFCLASSSVYLLNDLRDREQDRLHPKKRHRPIASGKLSRVAGRRSNIAALGAGGGRGVDDQQATGSRAARLLAINLLYSTWLKHQVILDVFAIASGFVLRVAGGGLAIHVEISHGFFSVLPCSRFSLASASGVMNSGC